MNKINKIQYERIGFLSIEKVSPLIEQFLNKEHKTRVYIDNYYVNINSLRLKTFFVKGYGCSCCTLNASFFAVERSLNSQTPYHLNLYGIDKNKKEVIFTHDHILARSLGGADNLKNTRTCCGPCNWNKGFIENLIKQSTSANEKEVLHLQLQQFLKK